MTLFRYHRGAYDDSMATVVEVASLDALAQLLAVTYRQPVSVADVKVASYGLESGGGPMFDERNGWSTYIVRLDGKAVGFTNGPMEPPGPMGPPIPKVKDTFGYTLKDTWHPEKPTEADMDDTLAAWLGCKCNTCVEYSKTRDPRKPPIDCELFQAYERTAQAWSAAKTKAVGAPALRDAMFPKQHTIEDVTDFLREKMKEGVQPEEATKLLNQESFKNKSGEPLTEHDVRLLYWAIAEAE